MKKTLVLLLVVALAACQSQKGYKITGTFEDVNEGKVYLGYKVNREMVNIDTVDIKKGKFELTGEVAKPETYYIQLADTKVSVPFILENAKLTFTGNAEKGEFKVLGSPNNDALAAYNSEANLVSKEQKELMGKINAASESGDTVAVKTMMEEGKELNKKAKDIKNTYINQNKDKEVAAYLIYSEAMGYGATPAQIDSMISILSPSLETSTYVEKMKERAAKLRTLEPGNPAPEIALPNMQGEVVALSSLKGKYVFVDFWATWCAPCRREIPHLKAAYDKYKDAGFEIYAVSMDDDAEAWKTMVAEKEMNWIHVSDLKAFNSPVVNDYVVVAIPTTMLLDKEGKIIARNLRGEEFEKKMEELFEKK